MLCVEVFVISVEMGSYGQNVNEHLKTFSAVNGNSFFSSHLFLTYLLISIEFITYRRNKYYFTLN